MLVLSLHAGSYPCFSPGAVIGRGRTFTAKASSSSTDGNNLSMSRDGNGLFIGSQRSGDGGGNGGRGGGGGRGGSGGSSGDGAAHPMRLWTFIFAGVLACEFTTAVATLMLLWSTSAGSPAVC